jgi:crossover junction endodeoxyribonuclease RuvC
MFCGIDPGQKGCLCVLENNTPKFFDWPKDNNCQVYFDNIAHYMETRDNTVKLAILELVHAMPGNGGTSMFNFGVNYGRWLSFLDIYHVPYKVVSPMKWQKDFTSKADGKDSKAQVFIAMQRMFPEAQLTGPKGGKMDGRSDALAMSVYAKSIS